MSETTEFRTLGPEDCGKKFRKRFWPEGHWFQPDFVNAGLARGTMSDDGVWAVMMDREGPWERFDEKEHGESCTMFRISKPSKRLSDLNLESTPWLKSALDALDAEWERQTNGKKK